MRRLTRRLASRRITPYLFFSYALFLVLLAIWGARVPAEVVRNISRLSPFWLLYVAAGVHLVLVLALFWPAIRQRVSLEPRGVADWTPVTPPPREGLAVAARRVGLRLRWLEPERAAVLYRSRWSPLATLLSHGALLLLPLAFWLSSNTRFEGQAWLVEGHEFTGTRAEYVHVEPEDAFEARAPELSFRVDTVDAKFWGPRLFFTDLRAGLSFAGEPRGEWATLSAPARRGATRVSLKGFNYTPSLELFEPGRSNRQLADLGLRLFPPGVEDSFVLPGLPHRVFVRLYPNSEGPAASPLNRSNDLEAPLLHATVVRGKQVVGRGWLRPGELLTFDGGYQLSFPRVLRGGDFVVHRDCGYPLLWVALVVSLFGFAWRVLLPPTRLWVTWDEDGAARAGLREDAFSRGRAAALLQSWRSA